MTPYRTVVKLSPIRTTAYLKTRNGERVLVAGDYQAERAVSAVILTKRDYQALLKIEKTYWKLRKRYNQAMNNSL
jgi:hypothetical protein